MKAKTLVILFIAGVLTLQSLAIVKVVKENRRLSDNFHSAISGMKYDMTGDSLLAAKTEKMLLDASEIKAYFPEIIKNISQLDVKMRQLERYSSIGTMADYQMSNKLRDTVQVRETIIQERIVRDTLEMQYIRYKDKWLDFQQAIVADSAYTAIQTRDSISIVQSWERPNRFWFIKYGRKRHTQTVNNANPHSRITYSIFVEKR